MKNKIKANIEQVAAEQNRTALEVITDMQSALATLGDEKTLETISEIKSEYIALKFEWMA